MKYTIKEIGEGLNKELEKGYSVERLSNWAFNMLISMRDDRTEDASDILNRLSLMEAGPGFEYTYEELKSLIEIMILKEKNPFKQMDNNQKNNI